MSARQLLLHGDGDATDVRVLKVENVAMNKQCSE